jgi:tetratricopeptide (TPR) repeat protein
MKIRQSLIRAMALSFFTAATATQLVYADPAAIVDGQRDLLSDVQAQWAKINYELDEGQRAVAFADLSRTTESWTVQQPKNAAAYIWHGIVLSSQAGAQGGLGALSLAKAARESLEKSLKLDPKALQGSAHTSLATLYAKVPGFTIGFGSDKKARQHFEQALALNPNGIDPNFFYAEFLAEEGERERAIEHLQRALAAPARSGRELADNGRRAEIQNLLTTLRAKS